MLSPDQQRNQEYVKVDVATTWIRIACNRYGVMPNGFTLADFVRKTLHEKEWNPRVKCLSLVAKYLWFNQDEGYAYFPRYSLDQLKEYLSFLNIKVSENHIRPIEPGWIKAEMNASFQLRDNQIPVCDFLTDDMTGGFKPLALQTGLGKSLRNDTPVRIPGGWKEIGQIQVNDQVITVDGSTTIVKGVYPQGKLRMWRVIFEDGRYVDTSDNHLWTTIRCYQGKALTEVISTKQIFTSMMRHPDRNDENNKFYIPLPESEKCEPQVLPMDPYLLGLFLASGHVTDNQCIVITVNKVILEQLDRISGINKDDLHTWKTDHGQLLCKVRGVSGAKWIHQLQVLSLDSNRDWEKTIPESYLNGTYDQKLQLIRGILDTYHTLDTTFSSIITTFDSQQLASDVQLLIRSIGGKCWFKRLSIFSTFNHKKKVHYRYRLSIKYQQPDVLFSSSTNPSQQHQLPQVNRGWYLKILSISPLIEEIDCTCIEVDHPSHLYVTKDYIVTHNTASAIYAAVKLGYPTLIILQGLIDQWLESIYKFTNIPKDKVFVIKGYESVGQLWEKIKGGYRPYIVIGSTRTLAMYCVDYQKNYKKIPPFHCLCEALGFGTKIIDEAHLNFNTNCMLDLRMNIKMNIYLSATYQRSSRDGRRIFHMYFPEKLMYGKQFAKQYTTVQMAHYHLCIPKEDVGKFRGVHGYNHSVYERYIRKRPKFMKMFIDEVISPLMNIFFFEKKKPGQHCLILVQTRKFAEELFKRLLKKVDHASIAIFFSGDPGNYGNEDNLKKDVIISTISSCGTGRDIKGLKTCICTVSMASQPQSIQCLGRLREIPNEDTFYVDMCNDEIFSQRNHAKARMGYFKPKSKEIFEFNIR